MTRKKNVMDRFFALKKPCDNCPFRKEGAIELQPGRVEGIIDSLLTDDHMAFHCHKTVDHDGFNDGVEDEDDDQYAPSGKEAMCAGAMVYLQKVGRMSVQMRLGVITGHYDIAAMAAQAGIVIDEPTD